jgi:hypothetical protein
MLRFRRFTGFAEVPLACEFRDKNGRSMASLENQPFRLGSKDRFTGQEPEDQENDENRDEDEEQYFSDRCRRSGDSAEAEDRRDYRDDEKYESPFQHVGRLRRGNDGLNGWFRPRKTYA